MLVFGMQMQEDHRLWVRLGYMVKDYKQEQQQTPACRVLSSITWNILVSLPFDNCHLKIPTKDVEKDQQSDVPRILSVLIDRLEPSHLLSLEVEQGEKNYMCACPKFGNWFQETLIGGKPKEQEYREKVSKEDASAAN